MEELNIRHGSFIVVRKVLGVINLICAGLWIVANLGDLKIFDWIYFTAFMFSGGALVTNGFGTEKSFIQAGEGYLKIKWINRFRSVLISDAGIRSIRMTRFKVIIERIDKKPLNLSLDFLERDQKKELYEYFIEYARIRNLELIRDF